EFGCSSNVANRQAESMKSPRPIASIKYSGQWWYTAASTSRSDSSRAVRIAAPARSLCRVATSSLIGTPLIPLIGCPLAPARLQELGHGSRPAGLMACAETGAVVTVEIFV